MLLVFFRDPLYLKGRDYRKLLDKLKTIICHLNSLFDISLCIYSLDYRGFALMPPTLPHVISTCDSCGGGLCSLSLW